MEANTFIAAASSIMIQQMYQQYRLSYLLYVDGSWECSHGAALQTSIWHPNSLKALLGTAVGLPIGP